MRDHTCQNYCDFLWINDLLSLKKSHKNQYKCVLKRNGEEKTVTISNVTVFGTVVDINYIGDRGILYSVDDGTGIICCKHNDTLYNDILDTVRSEQRDILDETFMSVVENRSVLNESTCGDDSIFNDRSLQEEELMAMKRSKLRALQSIWYDIEDSFLGMVKAYNVGDTVIVHGRLYDYRYINQIHVNIIRPIDVKEEIQLTWLKLLDGHEPLVEVDNGGSGMTRKFHLVENIRKSGLMTFDHIHHLETREMPTSTLIASDENCDSSLGNRKRRKSIVQPPLEGAMTFDTITDLNESGPQCKILKTL